MNFTLLFFERKKNTSFIFLCLGIFCIFLSSSCQVLPKKFPGLKVQEKRKQVVDAEFDESIRKIDESLEKQVEFMESLDQRLALLEEKHNNMQMETKTYERLKNELNSFKENTNAVISSMKESKAEIEAFRSKEPTKRRYYSDYEIEYKEYLTNVINRVTNISEGAILKNKELIFYDDLLNTDLSEEFELSVFFPSGVYKLGEEELPAAEEAFMPLVNQITTFVNKYPDKLLSIRIITKGYADSQPIKENSGLGKELSKLSNEEKIDSKELNRVLSELRASEISTFILGIIGEGNPELTNTDKYEISMEPVGMGETYPNPNIADYKKEDRRRRIVSIFWDVFPSN